jgi:hypothetical protein
MWAFKTADDGRPVGERERCEEEEDCGRRKALLLMRATRGGSVLENLDMIDTRLAATNRHGCSSGGCKGPHVHSVQMGDGTAGMMQAVLIGEVKKSTSKILMHLRHSSFVLK